MASYMGSYTFKYKPDEKLIRTVHENAVKGDDGKLYIDLPYVAVSYINNISTILICLEQLF